MDSLFEMRVQALKMAAGLAIIASSSLLLNAAPGLTNCVPVPAGLVSWWPGEGSAADVRSGANGSPHRGVKFARGKVGQCFSFNGINGGINVPDVPALALTGSLTLEGWLLVPQAPSVPGMVLFRGDTRSGLDPYYVSVEPQAGTSGLLIFVVWGEDNVNVSITAPMPIGAWTHVAATLEVDSCSDRTSLLTLYTNAVIAAATNTTIRPLWALDPDYQPGIGIGNHSSQPGPFNYPFRGMIDELSLYDRALSNREIQAIYNAGSAGKCSLPHGSSD